MFMEKFYRRKDAPEDGYVYATAPSGVLMRLDPDKPGSTLTADLIASWETGDERVMREAMRQYLGA
jgi:hypothetical protein